MIKITQLLLINLDNTTTELIPQGPIKDMLKTDKCYVLVADDSRKIYLWKGVKSSVRSKFIGVKRSQEIRGQVGMHYSIIPLDEGDEDAEFIKLIGGRTEGGIAKQIKGQTVAPPSVHPLRERNVFGPPEPADGMNIAESKTRATQYSGDLYRGEGSMTVYMKEGLKIDFQEIMDKLEEIPIPAGFEREFIIIGNQAYSVVEKVQQFLGEKQVTKEISKVGAIPEGIFFAEDYSPRIITENGKTLAIEFLKRTYHETKHNTRAIAKKTGILSKNGEKALSNSQRILNLLRKEVLTSNQIANSLGLSKEITRTYLLRLKKKNQIRKIGKEGRFYIYAYNVPIDSKVLSFKEEINQRISELEAKVNILATKPVIDPEEPEFFESKKVSVFSGFEKETPIVAAQSSQILEIPSIQPDNTLQSLLTAIPEIKAALLVSNQGLPIVSALPQGVDENKVTSILALLYSCAERAISEMNQGDFDTLYVKSSEGYFLVFPAGPNAVLAVSTTSDVRLGLIFLDCKRTCEKIAELL